jgi:uncharacterized membrane protein
MGFHHMGMKCFGPKAAGAKGFFGFIVGFFKMLFFGIFFIIFAVVGLILFFAMRKKMQNQNFQSKDNFTKNRRKALAFRHRDIRR